MNLKTKLGDLVSIQGGGTPNRKESTYWNGDIPWASVKDIKDFKLSRTEEFITQDGVKNSATNIIPKETVVVVTRMAVGRACITDSPIAINQDLKALFCSSKILPRYLLWFLISASTLLNKKASGATVKGIKIDALKDLDILLPPLEEQKRIATILDKADAIRRKRKEAIALTEELLRSTFLDMFGDPVTNPKGWDKRKLSKLGRIITGNTPPRANPENYGDDIEWIKSDNITTPYHFLTYATERLSSEGKKIARIVPPNSILVACIAGSRSSIGRAALADREVAFNQQINAIVPNSNIDPYFLYAHFFVAQHLVQAQSTNSMKGLVSKSRFSNIEFIHPPEQKQREFGRWFSRFHNWSNHLRNGEEDTNNLFNSLLQKAFRGEL